MLINRARTAKEHLSVTQAVTIDHIAGRPLKLTRTDFERLAARLLRELARFTSMTFGLADRAPEAVVVIGGGVSGQHATDVAIGMGAEVTLLDTDLQKLRTVYARHGSRVRALASTGMAIREAVLDGGYVERGELTLEQLDEALDVLRMTRP